MEYELYHHGILGMHWGIRTYQNKDGTWTEAGKRRYGSGSGERHSQRDEHSASSRSGSSNIEKKSKSPSVTKEDKKVKKAENAYTVASGKYYANPTRKNERKMNLAYKELEWAKQDKKNAGIKEKIKQEAGEKSKHRLKLEEHYRQKGMTQEEAEIAAYKRARTEKILAVTAGLTVAAAVAYVSYKHYDKFADKVIKSGTVLQNISTNSNKGVEDAFYAAYKKPDMLKYRGLFGNQLRDRLKFSGSKDGGVFKTTISAKSNIKVASNENAKKIFIDLVKSDSEYAKNLEAHLEEYGFNPRTAKAADLLKKGIVDDTVWEETNHWLVDHGELGTKISSKLYQKLKDAGYDAILDTNDLKYSGYRAKRPVIIFNGAEKLSVISSKKLSDVEIDKDAQKATLKLIRAASREYAANNAKELASTVGAPVSVGAAGIGIAKASEKRSENQIVQQYRKEHPNTKLSYMEILRMQERKKISGEY